MTHEAFRERIILALHNELRGSEQQEFDEHLTSCAACAKVQAEMQETLRLMDKRMRPEPDEAYWMSYEDEVMAKIGQEREPKRKKFILRPARVPAWAYGIAAVLLVAAGIYLGRSLFRPEEISGNRTNTGIASDGAQTPDSTNAMVLSYLERSRNVLLGVVNADESSYPSPVLEQQQRASRRLIEQGAVIKAALNQPDQQQMRQLIGQLEVVLLQLANIEVRPGVPMVEIMKQGVDRNSILLKINLEQMKAKSARPASQQKSVRNHS